jgi:hypothetical protein
MRSNTLNWTLCLLLLLQFVSGCEEHSGSAPVATPSANTVMQSFFNQRSQDSWRALLLATDSDPTSHASRQVTLVCEYVEEELKRDLPNSMSLKGNPDEVATKTDALIAQTLLSLKSNSDNDLWRLLVVLVQQDFDDSYHYAAGEMAYRLFPDRYIALEKSCEPVRSEMLAEIRERWSSGPTDPEHK